MIEARMEADERDQIASVEGVRPRVGRPYAITPEIEKILIQALKEGQSISVACGLAGVSMSAYYAHSQRFPEFKESVSRARARGLVELDQTVLEAVKVEAALGNAHSLVSYYKMRLALWQNDQQEDVRREREAERAEEMSGTDSREVFALIVAAVRRELGGGGGTDRRIRDPRTGEPVPPSPADARTD